MIRDGFLTVADVAGKMNVSEATVWALVKRREVDRYKFPGDRRTYVAEGDLAKLMEPEKLTSAPRVGRPRGSSMGKAAA
jgi:hypothetical protein